jgi:chromate transporter
VTEVRTVRTTDMAAEVFRASLKLGLTSFGGPIAHLAHFERTYVQERGWLSRSQYAGIVGLCQLLPGPTSSQVGFLIGYHRAGRLGALAAWTGFTLPSALLMYGFASLTRRAEGPVMQAIVHGLMLAAVAVVAQAVWRMARTLCPDWRRKAIAVLGAVLLLLHGGAVIQLAVMLIGALGGWLLCRAVHPGKFTPPANSDLRLSWILVAAAGGLLFALPVLATCSPHGLLAFAKIFYQAGALVFGGGHVVLPILRDALVPNGWISDSTFLTGYGFAQAVPGPLFAFAAYVGAVSVPGTASMLWAAVALIAIFLPGLLLASAGMPLWSRMLLAPGMQAALAGVNAAVVGILAAALYQPVWTTAVHSGLDAIIAVSCVVLLAQWHLPPILVIALCVIASAITASIS